MSSRLIRISFAAFIAALLGACGDASVFGEDEGGNGQTPGGQVPATLALLTSAPQLSSASTTAANGLTLTATVKDADNNIVEGAAVSFSTADTGVDLTVTRATTDASGTAQASLSVGDDPSNRSVTITATSGSATDTVTIDIVGTSITLSGPTSAQFNTPVSFTATLTDSGGAGIPSRVVTFTSPGGTFTPAAPTTNTSGQVTVAFTPTTSSASTTVTASALGVSASSTVALSQDNFTISAPTLNQEVTLGASQTVTVNWTRSGSAVPNGATVRFSTTRGTLSASTATVSGGQASVTISSSQAGFATITATGLDTSTNPDSTPSATVTVEFVATTPDQLALQIDPAVISTNGTSTISAVVRDVNNNLVKNQVVLFTVNDTTGGTLSSGEGVTDSQGTARVTYTATSTPSAQNGVEVTALLRDEQTIADVSHITVGSIAARVVLGTGNELNADPSVTEHSLPYSAIVTDNAGNTVTDAELRVTIIPLYFGKGFFEVSGGKWVQVVTAVCPNEDVNLNGILDTEDANSNGVLDPGEDLDSDSTLDSEDTDLDGILDPGNPASVPSTPRVDAGTGTFPIDIVYNQDRSHWVDVRLTARATVSGTEAVERALFTLPGDPTDYNSPDTSPPGQISPYGVVGRCDLDDENVPNVQFDITSQNTGEADAEALTVTLRLSAAFTEDVLVPISFAGTASPGTDYTETAPAKVLIPEGDTEATFTINIINDGVVEDEDETIEVEVGQPLNALIGTNDLQTITILDNDVANAAACNDDVDNDSDGFTDYDGADNTDGNADDDPECASPADDDESV